MNRRFLLIIFPLLCLFVLSGCWDRRELNDRAIWLASGFDADEGGKVRVSGQVVVPYNMTTPSASGAGGGGGTQDNFIVVSEAGLNVGDILMKLQSFLAREVFFGQRLVIFLGEEFAKQGLHGKPDNTTRLSEASLRTDMFIVKGDTAINALKVRGRLESIPLFSALKKHERSGGRGETTFLDFLIATNRDGIEPTLPVVELSESNNMKPSKFLEIAGVAVLDPHLKLAGYLNMEEDRDLLWLLNRLHEITVSVVMEEGRISAQFDNLKSKIVPSRKRDGNFHFDIILRGNGNLLENETTMDPSRQTISNLFERKMEETAAKHMEETIRKVQTKYGLDIFGFGVAVHRKFPGEWRNIKERWNKEFKKATFNIKADLNLETPGLTGKPAI